MPDNQSIPEVVLKLECYLTSYKYPLHGWQKVVHVAVPVCLALMWLPCVALNFVALLVYVQKRMRSKVSNLFILNTIVGDLLTGVVSIPLTLSHYILIVNFQKRICLLYLSMVFAGFVFTAVSFLMISFAAIDRYLAVFKPYFYSARLAHCSSFYYTVMVLTWLFSVSIVGSSFLTPGFAPVIYSIAGLVLVILIIVFMQIKVWLAIRQVHKTSQRQLSVHDSVERKVSQSCLKENTHKGSTHTNIPRDPKESNSKYSKQSSIVQHRTTQIKRDNRKSNRVMSFMLTSLCVCYLPYIATTIVWKTAKKDLDIHSTIGTIAIVLVILKSLLNPIIYCYSMPSVKMKMKRLAFFWKKDNFQVNQQE